MTGIGISAASTACPQGLKPVFREALGGTAEAVPSPQLNLRKRVPAARETRQAASLRIGAYGAAEAASLQSKVLENELLTEVAEGGAGLEALGKFVFIGKQSGANQTSVGEGKAKLLHFLFGFVRRPSCPCGRHPDGSGRKSFYRDSAAAM